MQNNILYTGIVSIFHKRHPISITYNAGTNLFLNNICNTLRGETLGFQRVVPQYMSLLVQDENCTQANIESTPDYNAYSNNTVLIHPISITSRYVQGTKQGASIVFASMLSSNLVNTSVYNSKYNKGFIVLLNASQQILAYSEVSLNDLKGVLSTSNVQTQANIEWKLNFANSKLLEAK